MYQLKLRNAFVLSLFLHFCILIHFQKVKTNIKEPVNEKIPIKIKLIKPQVTKTKSTLQKRKSERNRVKVKKEIFLSQLGIGDNPIDDRVYVGKFGDDDREEKIGEVGQGSLLYYLYKQIEQHIYYPKLLERNRIYGVVTTRVVIDKKGKYRADLSRINTHSPYLRTLVSRILKKSLKYNLKHKIKTKKKYLILDIAINFALPAAFDKKDSKQHNFMNGHYFSYLYQRELKYAIQFGARADTLNMPMNRSISFDTSKAIDNKSLDRQQERRLLERFLKMDIH